MRAAATVRTATRPKRRPVAPVAPRRRSPAHRSNPRSATTSWEIRSFVAVIAFIATLFVTAVLYLGQTTAVSAGGYEVQRLTELRDELRRQSSLLEVRIATLDSPTRIETEAKRLGLVRPRSVPILPAEALAAAR